jgi:glycosyltransferase involved in cell wall biosynthesis
MTFVYADPGLHDGVGHHANSCRFITQELRRRGVRPVILAHYGIEPALREELGALAHFRGFSYHLTDGDPICGWLNAFHDVGRRIRKGLLRLAISRDDRVYLNSVQPGVVLGVAEWLSDLKEDELPQVVMEFGTEPGVDIDLGPDGFQLATRDPRSDSRAVLYRFAAGKIPKAAEPRLHMMTFEPNASAAYSALLGRPVGVLPFLQRAVTTRRSRIGASPRTVAVIGHQRLDKGYQLMPDVVRALLPAHDDIRILVHNGAPRQMVGIQQKMRDLAAADRRIILDERVADHLIWASLLDAADLIVCPYAPERYALSYSAVVCEALANGIPTVVPRHTALSRLLREFGSPGTTFSGFDAAAVAAATGEALASFDRLATLARQAADRWAGRFGPGPLVDAILGAGDPAGPPLISFPSMIALD